MKIGNDNNTSQKSKLFVNKDLVNNMHDRLKVVANPDFDSQQFNMGQTNNGWFVKLRDVATIDEDYLWKVTVEESASPTIPTFAKILKLRLGNWRRRLGNTEMYYQVGERPVGDEQYTISLEDDEYFATADDDWAILDGTTQYWYLEYFIDYTTPTLNPLRLLITSDWPYDVIDAANDLIDDYEHQKHVLLFSATNNEGIIDINYNWRYCDFYDAKTAGDANAISGTDYGIKSISFNTTPLLPQTNYLQDYNLSEYVGTSDANIVSGDYVIPFFDKINNEAIVKKYVRIDSKLYNQYGAGGYPNYPTRSLEILEDDRMMIYKFNDSSYYLEPEIYTELSNHTIMSRHFTGGAETVAYLRLTNIKWKEAETADYCINLDQSTVVPCDQIDWTPECLEALALLLDEYNNYWITGDTSGESTRGDLIVDNANNNAILLSDGGLWIDNGNEERLNWQDQILLSNNSASVDWGSYILIDSAVNSSVNWDTRIAYDNVPIKSLDWGLRQASNSDGDVVIDWDAYELYAATAPTTSRKRLNWQLGILYDRYGFESVEFTDRVLTDASDYTSVDWQNHRLYYHTALKLDWSADTLVSNSNIGINLTDGTLINSDGNVSVNFEDSSLQTTVANVTSSILSWDEGEITIKSETPLSLDGDVDTSRLVIQWDEASNVASITTDGAINLDTEDGVEITSNVSADISSIDHGLMVNNLGGSNTIDNFIVSSGNVAGAFGVNASDDVVITGTGVVRKVNAYTTSQTLTNLNHVVRADCTSNAVSLTLPATPITGQEYRITCVNDDNTCLILNNGEYLFGEDSSFQMYQGETIIIHYDSSYGWW